MSPSNICYIHVPHVVRCIKQDYEESTTDDDGRRRTPTYSSKWVTQVTWQLKIHPYLIRLSSIKVQVDFQFFQYDIHVFKVKRLHILLLWKYTYICVFEYMQYFKPNPNFLIKMFRAKWRRNVDKTLPIFGTHRKRCILLNQHSLQTYQLYK